VCAGGAALAACAAATLGACNGGSGFPGPRPEALLAWTPEAGTAFDAIRRAWSEPGTPPAMLRSMLDGFLLRFPRDPLAPLARVALALVAMRQGDLGTAEALLKATRDLPPGSAHDLWAVASAKSLRLRGEAEGSLALLRPLVGKTVDPMGRSLFQEELTLAALTTHREFEGISYMDAWLRASGDDERAQTLDRVRPLVARLPKDVVIGALDAMRTRRATFGYGVDIERVLSDRLVSIAIESNDVQLARMLLDADAGAVAITGDAGLALGELATSRRGMNVVAGRTLGVLLPTGSPDLRDESAGVLRGVMWALGLPRGVRAGPSAAPPAAARPRPAIPACGTPEPSPELEEPGPEEELRLATRDDAGMAERTESALDELAGEGAGVVVAGLDAGTATRALQWGEAHHVPVIAVVTPDESGGPTLYGFLLGEPHDAVARSLALAAPALARSTVVPVVDSAEIASSSAQQGPLTLGKPVSCDVPPTRAGDPRFPVGQWARDKTEGWLVSGSPACALDLLQDLATAHGRGTVALTLEASAVVPRTRVLRVVTARAGVIPAVDPSDPRASEVQRFTASLGALDWWTALGRDAATLARIALRSLPTDEVSDPAAVEGRRARVREALAAARAPLWTTEASGWSQDRTMPRTVCVLESPEAPPR
jgi:hypothetical protein